MSMEITIKITPISNDDSLTREDEQAIQQAINEAISDSVDLQNFDVDTKFYNDHDRESLSFWILVLS